MRVKLESVGNPNYHQDPNSPLYGVVSKTVEVISMKEAKTKCLNFIEENDLGSSNWSGGQILDDDNKVIAHVSYNGRVWEGEQWTPQTKEIKV